MTKAITVVALCRNSYWRYRYDTKECYNSSRFDLELPLLVSSRLQYLVYSNASLGAVRNKSYCRDQLHISLPDAFGPDRAEACIPSYTRPSRKLSH